MIRILYIGVGKPVPTFIDRRVHRLLGQEGIDLKVVIERSQQVSYPEKNLIRLSTGRDAVTHFPFYVWMFFRYGNSLRKLMRVKVGSAFGSRFKWAMKMLPLTRLPGVDIVHLQWISFVPEYAWLRSFYSCKIVGSARGTQVTIQPAVDEAKVTLLRNAFAVADFIHCVSDAIRKHCIRWGADERKLRVVYNGIDTTVFCPSEGTGQTRVIGLVSVGALIWRKGYIYQLLLVRRLKDAGMNVTLTIVGEGEGADFLLYTIERLEIQKEVRLVGKRSPIEVLALLQGATIFISTSIAEGLSNSVVEAAAAGLPCFVFDCEGMDEVIEHQKTGFIFSFGDIAGLCDTIIATGTDRETLRAMGVAARARVLDGFREEKCTEDLIAFYKEVSAK